MTVDYPAWAKPGMQILVKAIVQSTFDYDLTVTVTITHATGEIETRTYALLALSSITHEHMMVMPEEDVAMKVQAAVFGADLVPVAECSVDIIVRSAMPLWPIVGIATVFLAPLAVSRVRQR